jgi:hypothetical protein
MQQAVYSRRKGGQQPAGTAGSATPATYGRGPADSERRHMGRGAAIGPAARPHVGRAEAPGPVTVRGVAVNVARGRPGRRHARGGAGGGCRLADARVAVAAFVRPAAVPGRAPDPPALPFPKAKQSEAKQSNPVRPVLRQ